MNDEGKVIFGMDTYAYMPLPTSQRLEVDFKNQIYKQNELDDYIILEDDKHDRTIRDVCTLEELETFHSTLFLDLYRRDRDIKFNTKPEQKKYYILPLIKTQESETKCEYVVDIKLMRKVMKLKRGYSQCQ